MGALCVQGLRSLEMINVVGAYPTETEEFLSGMHGLTNLVVCNNTAAVKMAPMHCLASMPLLQVPPVSPHVLQGRLQRYASATHVHDNAHAASVRYGAQLAA